MHIADGFLPVTHAVGWTAAAVPFVVRGARRLSKDAAAHPGTSLTFAAAGGFTLLLSSLKLPSVAGSSSHPTGVGLGTLACGPTVMAVIGVPVLLLQALLLAHGGLTTLGANTMSMAVAGPWAAWGAWQLAQRVVSRRLAIVAAVAASSLATYGTTALQLALAFPDPVSGIPGAFLKFSAIFLITQIPLALAEGLFTVVAFDALRSRLDASGLVQRA